MAVFDWAESSNLSLEEEPRVNATQFGDGYEQRAADGINALVQRWDLNFEEVDNAIADEIIAFLRARAGVEAFDWTPKWGTVAIKVRCPKWSRSPDGEGLSRIAARFQQVFEP
ncbi:MAG: phage tail protein [Ramlibacter sp.]|nr:phage tail protein [Ramlibacter sp.]